MNSLSKLFITLSAGLLLHGASAEGAARGKVIHRNLAGIQKQRKTVVAAKKQKSSSGNVGKQKETTKKDRAVQMEQYRQQNFLLNVGAGLTSIASFAAFNYLYPKSGWTNLRGITTGIASRGIKLAGLLVSTALTYSLSSSVANGLPIKNETREKIGIYTALVLPLLAFNGAELMHKGNPLNYLGGQCAIAALETLALSPVYYIGYLLSHLPIG